MDPDLALQRLWQGAIFLGSAAVAGVVATWLVGVACRRARLPNGLTLLAQVLTPVALFYAGSLYLDAAGVVTRAEVTQRNEQISYGPNIPGAWRRSFWVTTRFQVADGPNEAVLWLGEADFDALHVGDRLDIRYVRAVPFIARPAVDSTRSLVPMRLLAGAAGVAAVCVPAWLALRRTHPGLLALLAFAALFFGVVAWVFPTPWETPLAEPTVRADAEVREVREVTHSFVSSRRTGTIEAPQPWQLVELTFVPQGRDQPVVALDGVDAGSVPDLVMGRRVPVVYSAASPRDVRLVGGRRTYRWREWQELGEYLALIAAAGVAVVLLGRLVGWWWRRMLGGR